MDVGTCCCCGLLTPRLLSTVAGSPRAPSMLAWCRLKIELRNSGGPESGRGWPRNRAIVAQCANPICVQCARASARRLVKAGAQVRFVGELAGERRRGGGGSSGQSKGAARLRSPAGRTNEREPAGQTGRVGSRLGGRASGQLEAGGRDHGRPDGRKVGADRDRRQRRSASPPPPPRLSSRVLPPANLF